MFTVAIVGRTNVGKTTLFNRLNKKQISIVHNKPGVTRDRQYSVIKYQNTSIRIVDTAGLEDDNTLDTLKERMFQQSMHALQEADMCVLVVDGRIGILDADTKIYKILRKHGKAFIVAVNKSENIKQLQLNDIYKLHSEEVVQIAAEHAIGINTLLTNIYNQYKTYISNLSQDEDEIQVDQLIKQDDTESIVPKQCTFSLAIVGKPNAGKSTITNTIIGEDRVITDHNPGTTRDSIKIPIKYKKYNINLIDTAGIRKKMSISEDLELMSVKSSLHAIDFAHVVMLVTDSQNPIESQDKTLLDRISSEGRPAIIICNKWDLIQSSNRKTTLEQIRHLLKNQKHCNQSFFTLSALKDKIRNNILDEAINKYTQWNIKLHTNTLNNWLREEFTANYNSPIIKGKRVKLKFITQTSIRPPTFTISSNSKSSDIPENYISLIKNKLAQHFNLTEIPIRIKIKTGTNPFKKRK